MNTLSLPQPEGLQDNRDLELVRRVLNVLFKWKWLIAICFTAVVIPIVIVTLLKTAQYEATTKIMIKSSRAEVAVSAGGPERFVNWPITPALINSEIQILRSLDLLQKAVEKSGYPLLPEGGDQNNSPGAKERALLGLGDRIRVTPIPDSNVIDVSFQDADGKQAANFLNTLAALYLEKHAAVHRGGENTAEFFDQQAVDYKARLEKAKEALAQYSGSDRIIDVSQEITLNLSKLSKLDETLKDLQAEIDGTEKEVATLAQQVRSEPDQIAAQKTIMVNPEATSVSLKIVELERQRADLLQRYTAKSRLVIDKENEIAALRKQLDSLQQHVAGDTVFAQNKVRENLLQQLMQRRAALDSFKAKKKALLQEMIPYQSRLNILKSKSLDLDRLQQEHNSIRDAYLMYVKKAQEARIGDAMDESKIVNVGVIQPALPPAIAVGQGLKMALGLGGVSGLALGIGFALLLEFFNLTMKNEDDIERFLGVPVLATIRHF